MRRRGYGPTGPPNRPARASIWIQFCSLALAFAGSTAAAADLTFNISYIAEANPFPPASGSNFSYADVWSEGEFVYVGSDRGFHNPPNHISNGPQGVSIFKISDAGIPTFQEPPTSPPAGFTATTYFGNEMEDVEVYNGIGYFASDVNGSTGRTGIDIVNLSVPFDPITLSRVDASDCLAGDPGVCAHGKVHTVSIQRINPDTDSEQRFMYTSDNDTSVVKITDVSSCQGDPMVTCNPQLVASLSLGLASAIDSHEVAVRNNRLYVASKNPSKTTEGAGDGWFHIYDVSTPASPVLIKAFETGTSTHTAMPTDDGTTLIVAEERNDGKVKIYNIENINSPNDPVPPPLATLSASSVCHNGTCISAHSPHHVHVHGNLMFIPWYEAGLQVFNISNRANPVLVGAFDTWLGTSSNFNGNWGVDLSLGLKRVLLSDRKRGLIVVDASGVVIPGDYNQDMKVDEADYLVWRNSFGETTSFHHDAPLADGNYDGVVNAADYVVWREHFGQMGPGFGAASLSGGLFVPEPASILLMAVAMGLAFSRFRVRRT